MDKKDHKAQHTPEYDPFTAFVTADWRARNNQDTAINDAPATAKHSDVESAVLQVYAATKKKAVAQVILNGYNIAKDESLGSLGSMRSFKIVRGDLWEQWHEQAALRLTDENGREAKIKVAALPVEDDGFGLIEFI